MQAILEAFPGGRTVVLLDNFEEVVDSETGKLHDPGAGGGPARAAGAADARCQGDHHHPGGAACAAALLSPGARNPLALDEGLPSPFAENILRARWTRTGSSACGMHPRRCSRRPASAPRATRGRWRPSSAILATDRSTTLAEVLADAERLLPEQVVEALVGEAFSRLDPLAQQVMQALAVLAAPVPQAAVDYLLQPYVPGIDSAPVLRPAGQHALRPPRGRALPPAPGRPQLRHGTDPRRHACRPGRLAASLHPLCPAASGRGVLPEHPHPASELEDRRRPGTPARGIRGADRRSGV